jgi:hypothetical protein
MKVRGEWGVRPGKRIKNWAAKAKLDEQNFQGEERKYVGCMQ